MIIDREIFQRTLTRVDDGDGDQRPVKNELRPLPVNGHLPTVFQQQRAFFPAGLGMIGDVTLPFGGVFGVKVVTPRFENNGQRAVRRVGVQMVKEPVPAHGRVVAAVRFHTKRFKSDDRWIHIS